MPTVFLVGAGSDSADGASSGDDLLRPNDGDLFEVGKVDDGCTWVGTLSASLLPSLAPVDSAQEAPEQQTLLAAVQGVESAEENRGGWRTSRAHRGETTRSALRSAPPAADHWRVQHPPREETVVEPEAAVSVPEPRHDVDVAVLVRRTHELLAAGVPLTLLLDLGDAAGPRSQQRYAAEGGDLRWVPRQR